MSHINASVEQVERPLLTPDEVMRLRPPNKRGRGNKERIVEPGEMLVFVSGHYPILGTQMLYFGDPVLARRASLPPPTKFSTIIGQKLRPQLPANRTPNLVSQAEPEPMSPLEAAFIAALAETEPPPPEHYAFVNQLEQQGRETNHANESN